MMGSVERLIRRSATNAFGPEKHANPTDRSNILPVYQGLVISRARLITEGGTRAS